MKRIYPEASWPESWMASYIYDLEEIYGEYSNLGYAYAYQNRRNQTLDMIREVLPAGATILDVAAAQGNFSLLLAELGYNVTWNDLRIDLVGYVKKKYEKGHVEFSPGNAFELQFPALFDAVLITEVIEHTAHPDEFMKNTARLVKPGGYIIMTTPNGAYFRNKLPKFSECTDPGIYESREFGPNAEDHIFLLHTDEVRLFASEVGLSIDKLVLFTNPLTNGHVKLAVLLKILPKSFVDWIEKLSRHLPSRLAARMLTQMAVRFRVST